MRCRAGLPRGFCTELSLDQEPDLLQRDRLLFEQAPDLEDAVLGAPVLLLEPQQLPVRQGVAVAVVGLIV